MSPLPLGTVASGPVAWVDASGRLEASGPAPTIGWWVLSEERWHRPEADQTTRQRLVEELPIVETAVRVPGGDVTATAAAVAGDGGAAPVLLEVHNGSPVPVAIAVVVGPITGATVDGDALVAGGRAVVRLGRRVGDVVRASSRDALAARLADGDRGGPGAGEWLAAVVPLPHAQSLRVVLGDADPDGLPGVEQLVSGWQSHLDRGATWVLPEPFSATARQLVALAGLGPERGASLATVAEHLSARLHLGWHTEAATLTDELLAAQRTRGRFGDSDADVVSVVSALAAWRLAGLPHDRLGPVVEAVAAGARRLERRAHRLAPPLADAAVAARREAARFLAAADQPHAARAARPGGSEELPRWPAIDDGIGGATSVVRSLVVDDDDGLTVAGGWTPTWWGASLDVRDVPTRWGRAAYSLRWHGDRPALLWELEPWDAAEPPPVTWRAPALDPDWAGSGRSGEALLRPATARPDTAPRVSVDHGASFAVWDPPAPAEPLAGAERPTEPPPEAPAADGGSFT